MRSRNVNKVFVDADVKEDDPVLVLDLYDSSEQSGEGAEVAVGWG